MSRDISIYVHIPFCERKCLYCDFLSFGAGKDQIDGYFDALLKEVKACKSPIDACIEFLKSDMGLISGIAIPPFSAIGIIIKHLRLILQS